jgi:hypothetical protein
MIGLWRIANEICIKFIIHLAYTGANDVIYAPRWMYNIFVTSCFLAQIHSLSSYNIYMHRAAKKHSHKRALPFSFELLLSNHEPCRLSRGCTWCINRGWHRLLNAQFAAAHIRDVYFKNTLCMGTALNFLITQHI